MMIDDGDSSKIHSRPRRGRRKPLAEQKFSSYLVFGFHTSVCLAIFLACYAFLLLGLAPLLQQAAPSTIPMHRGEVLRPVVQNAMRRMPHVPGQHMAEGLAENAIASIKRKVHIFRQDQDVTDASLMQKAAEEMEQMRQKRNAGGAHAAVRGGGAADTMAKPAPGTRSGFMVLGMHRSGTSMLSGLLVTGMGYNTGGPLIGGAFDNEKGFFELVPAVLQNDEFMRPQRIWWSANVIHYDSERALQDKKSGKISFEEGEKALKVFNNPANVPYLQKDPRMCITIKSWLPLLNHEPAIIFTYRHPLEVALSLKKRENGFTLEHGLRLWMAYNMRAIQNSQDLCRVTSSNERILADPLAEVQRISDALTNDCGVPPPASKLSQEDVNKFVDPNLQHNKKQREADDEKRAIIASFGDCKVRDYQSDVPRDSPAGQREHDLYLKAMKVYCDFERGKPYKADYEWPELI